MTKFKPAKRSGYDHKPALDSSENIIARLQRLAKGEQFTYHIGEIGLDAEKYPDVDFISAAARRLRDQGKVTLASRRVPGAAIVPKIRKLRRGPEETEVVLKTKGYGEGFEYIAIGTGPA